MTRLCADAVLPGSLPGAWPTNQAAGFKLADLAACFDGAHTFEERYEQEHILLRPIPRATLPVVKAAVADAVKARKLWLVFGTSSVFGETPSAVQLDGQAILLPPPGELAVADLLPPALPAAWTKDSEPATTLAALYAALKDARIHPWPETMFLDLVNAAAAQGYFARAEGSGTLVSLQHDGEASLIIRQTGSKPIQPPPLPTTSGRRSSGAVVLDVGEVQNLGDEIANLVSALAGLEPEVEVRISVKNQPGQDYSKASKILGGIKADWTL